MNYNLQTVISALKQYKPTMLPQTTFCAAVVIIILESENDLEIVLTKRASTLTTYSNDYSFPGGMLDPSDSDLYAAAKRELQEELGLEASTFQYITQLDDFISHDGNLVRPFVVTMRKSDFQTLHHKSDEEIEKVYFLKFENLQNIKDEPILHAITLRRPSYAYTDGEEFIWGLTASLLIHFSNIITGENRPLGKKIVDT